MASNSNTPINNTPALIDNTFASHNNTTNNNTHDNTPNINNNPLSDNTTSNTNLLPDNTSNNNLPSPYLASKTVLCKDKLMKRRMSQYLVNNDFNNSSPNHNSVEEIMNSELAECSIAERARQSSPEPEPEPVPIYRRNSSMMSIEELDKLFG
ncbi:33365_t:CDS:2, partial [Gigaspora margarita]